MSRPIIRKPAIDPSKGRLVITRRHMESVQIGDDITITVIHDKSGTKLAIVAPKTTHIRRTELDPL